MQSLENVQAPRVEVVARPLQVRTLLTATPALSVAGPTVFSVEAQTTNRQICLKNLR